MFIPLWPRQPVPYGVERPDGTFEVVTATHYRIDRFQNLHLYIGQHQVSLFKVGEWLYAERGLTEKDVDQRGI